MVIERPHSWLIVFYDTSESPSKQKVRLWREFKSVGAHYPQNSVCILPYNETNRRNLRKVERTLMARNERLIRLYAGEVPGKDPYDITQMFGVEKGSKKKRSTSIKTSNGRT